MADSGVAHKERVRRQVKWLPILLGLGVILATGTVVADVVLSYTLSNSASSTTSSPFSWQQGPNYATASGLSFITDTCNPSAVGAASTSCFSLSASVTSPEYVPTTLINMYTFQWLAPSATIAAAIPAGAVQASGTGVLPPGSCAYAFISNGDLGLTSFTYTAGSPCTITAAAPTAAFAACGGALATGATETINLLTAAVTGSTSCTIAAGTAAGGALEVSYYVYIPGVATSAALSSVIVSAQLT